MSGFPKTEGLAKEKGFPFLAKPFTLSSLTIRVREVLSNFPPQSEMRTNLLGMTG
jgi:hypothetical protein